MFVNLIKIKRKIYLKKKQKNSFFILLTQCLYFITPLPLNVTLFLKNPYPTAHLKIYYETSCSGKFSQKTQAQPGPSQHLRQNSFVALVSSFQPLINHKELHYRCYGSLKSASRVLQHILRLLKIINLSNECRCRAAICNFTKNILFHRLINYYLNSRLTAFVSQAIWFTKYSTASTIYFFSLAFLRISVKVYFLWSFAKYVKHTHIVFEKGSLHE